jgi:hypothetical protein
VKGTENGPGIKIWGVRWLIGRRVGGGTLSEEVTVTCLLLSGLTCKRRGVYLIISKDIQLLLSVALAAICICWRLMQGRLGYLFKIAFLAMSGWGKVLRVWAEARPSPP